jgi:hypothetical protein
MTFSKKHRSVLLLSLFFISLIFQIAYTFNVLSGKEFINKDHSTNLLPDKNSTDDNLLANFIEEETEDGDDDEIKTINFDLNLVLSYLHFNFIEKGYNPKVSSRIQLTEETSIYIAVRNLRI